MSRQKRIKLIQAIEAARTSRVVTYITSDRPPAGAQIAEDALRPIYDQLRAVSKVDKIDLFIYSRGGAMDVPWRIATALRQTAKSWNILIPFRANSAATVLALGADEIVLGQHGELGPIDPHISIQKMSGAPGGPQTAIQDSFNVEDVMAYLRFVEEKAGIKEQAQLSDALSRLSERIDAIALGNAYRTHTHIRDVARGMLQSQSKPKDEETRERIVKTLAEEVYAHGHAISLKDAQSMGLSAIAADAKLDAAMWHLLEEYEDHLKIRKPLDALAAVATDDRYTEKAVIAVVETTNFAYELQGEIEVRARRQLPAQLNIPLNPTINVPGANQQQMQQILQSVQQRLGQQIAADAEQAIRKALAPHVPYAAEAGFRNGVWTKVP